MNKRLNKKNIFLILGILMLAVIGYLLPVPAALEQAAVQAGSTGKTALRVLGVTVLAVCWWSGAVFPDWLTAIAMLTLWTLLGGFPFSTVFGSFAGTSTWIIFGAFCLATAISKTGLFKRLSWFLLQVFPPTFQGQTLAMIVIGLICSPLIPSATAKALLGVSIAMGLADTMEYAADSKGRYGMFFAAWAGFGLSAPIFVSGSVYGYTLMGVLPEDCGIDWGRWALAMIPWTIVVFVSLYVIIRFFFKPVDTVALSKEYAREQYRKLGKLEGKELQTAIVLCATVVLWTLESRIGVNASVSGMIAAFFCFALGILEPKEIYTAPNWNLVVFVGGVLSLGSIFSKVGIDLWVQEVLNPLFGRVSSTILVCVLIAVITILIRFLLAAHSAAIIVMMAIFAPVAATIGLSPFVIGMIIYTSGMCWFVPYQNVVFTTSISCTEGKVKYNKTLLFCVIYEIISMAACLISLPYWKMLGV